MLLVLVLVFFQYQYQYQYTIRKIEEERKVWIN